MGQFSHASQIASAIVTVEYQGDGPLVGHPCAPGGRPGKLHTEFSTENNRPIAAFALLRLYEKIKLEIMNTSVIGV